MKTILCLLLCCLPVCAQSRTDIGLRISASDSLGTKNPSAALTGNVLLRSGSNAIEGEAAWVFRSIKLQTSDGKAVATRVLYRRYFGSVYAATGITASHQTTNLFSSTATSPVVGGGVEVGSVRLQATWAAPDFTSIHDVQSFDFEGELIHRLSKDSKTYLAFRPAVTIARFTQQRGVSSIYDRLTGSKFGVSLSLGRFW